MQHLSQLGVLVGQRLLAALFSPAQDILGTIFGLNILLAVLRGISSILWPSNPNGNEPKSYTLSNSTRRVVVSLGLVGAVLLGNVVPDDGASDRAANLLMIITSWVCSILLLKTRKPLQLMYSSCLSWHSSMRCYPNLNLSSVSMRHWTAL